MRLIEIAIEERTARGSTEVSRLRKADNIPGIAYRKGENILVLSDRKHFTNVCRNSTTAQVFRIKSESPRLNGKLCIVKDIQFEYLKRMPLHFDLQIVTEEEKIVVEVPIKFVGEAIGVKNSGGLLTILKHTLFIRCSPLSVPDEVVVDISGLDLGDSIHVGDINLPQNLEHYEDLKEPVVSVVREETESSEQSQSE
ncbi:MAG: 50S ribosomal protein L25 [Deltaproteobacteria bacterium]|nr:50S ribosomal protein L25 [Deltaproteobacteria bacterium]